MKTICLQFQPKRAPKVSVTTISALMLRIATAHDGVRQFTLQRGRASNQYINYLFVGHGVQSIWSAIRAKALQHRRVGSSLRRACIATAEGSRGWDDYVLLHHFDPRQNPDKLARS